MIQFNVGFRWSEETIAIRLAQIVRGEGSSHEGVPPWKIDDGHWQLDRGNDWFLTKIDANKYQLSYRYATTEHRLMLEGMQAFLNFVFH